MFLYELLTKLDRWLCQHRGHRFDLSQLDDHAFCRDGVHHRHLTVKWCSRRGCNAVTVDLDEDDYDLDIAVYHDGYAAQGREFVVPSHLLIAEKSQPATPYR